MGPSLLAQNYHHCFHGVSPIAPYPEARLTLLHRPSLPARSLKFPLEHPPQPTLVVCLSSRSFTLEEFPGYLFSLVATFAVPSALLYCPIVAVSQQARSCSAGAEALPGRELFLPHHSWF